MLADIENPQSGTRGLDEFIENVAEGALRLSENGIVLCCNAGFSEMMRRPRERLIGVAFSSMFRVPQAATAAAAGSKQEIELMSDAGPVAALMSASRIDLNGQVSECLTITDNSGQQKKLRQSEARLKLALESANMGAWEWDVRTHRSVWDAKLNDLLGLPRDSEQNADEFFRVVHPDDREELRRSLQGAIESGDDWRKEFRIVRPNGEERWLVGVGRVMRDEDGTSRGMIGIHYDVTKRKRGEEALRRSEARYRMLHETLRDPIVQVAMDGRIVDFNELYRQMLGYTAEELRGMTYRDLTPARWHDFEANIVREQIIPRGYSEVYEKEYVRKDGTVIPVELRSMLARDATGSPETMWAIVRDLTERRANEERMRSLNDQLLHVARLNELSQVSAGIAHELNQPLSAMLNYAGTAKRMIAAKDPALLQRAWEAIDKAGEQAVRASEIIRRLRAFVERRPTDRKVDNINAIVEEAITLALIGTKTGGVPIRVELAPDLPPVFADRVQIQQVLVNLLHNAMDAMASSPIREITVHTGAAPNGGVEVLVADTGPGVPPELAGRIFMPFVTTKPSGMGIGLVISRSIIEAHGGALDLLRGGERGATFRFLLPRAT